MNKPETANLPSNPLDCVRIVLSHPSLPRNIGSVARAMKTMGLRQLVLVNPKRFPDPEAETLASGAVDILERAQVVATLDEALRGCTQTVAVSARRREVTVPVQNPRELAPWLLARANAGEAIAVVFGTEMSGLTNDEVRACNRIMSIPANPEYSSLNLAQAVQVVAYELRMAIDSDVSSKHEVYPLATHESLEQLYRHLEETLVRLQFLDPANPKRLMPRLRRLFGKSQLEQIEVDILRGILRAADDAVLAARPDSGVV